jgi:hypothetical protein
MTDAKQIAAIAEIRMKASAAKAPIVRFDLAFDGSVTSPALPQTVWLADAVLLLADMLEITND